MYGLIVETLFLDVSIECCSGDAQCCAYLFDTVVRVGVHEAGGFNF